MAEEPGSGKALSRLKGLKDSIDRRLDRRLTKAAESVDRSSEAAGTAKERASAAMKKVDETGGRYIDIVFSREGFYNLFDRMIEHPKVTLMITLIITSILIVPLIKWDAVDKKINEDEDPPNLLGYLNLNMNAAFDVYLPEGEETSNILNEVRENWTIDLFVLYFETQNAFDRNVGTNITDVGILEEITIIERGLNSVENDRGEEDDVIYVLSIASIIRELNGSTPQALYALQHQVEKATGSDTSLFDPLIDAMANQSGSYEIPDDQPDVNDLVHQIEPRILGHIVLDTNGDDIWDSAICLIGLVEDLDFDEITDRVRDSYQNEVKEYNSRVSDDMKLKVRDTGTIPVTKDVQDRSVKEGVNALVIATLFILVALFIFHRTLKILLIALVPVSVSMALTFSIIAITRLPITPQVIAVGPILIALGVAYGLYIANRYAEESQIEDKQERIKVAVRTTGKAVFLSAITTAGGFASLMVTNILPMQTVGLTLTLGIIINYMMAMLLVPPLVLILDYHKRGDILGDKFKALSPIPVNHTKKILAAGIVLLLLSLGILMSGGVGSDVDFLSFAPDDQESLITYKDYAEIFKGGEIGMVIVRGAPAVGDDYENSMKDYDVLQSTENLENQINEVEDTWAISIVDIFKTLRLRNIGRLRRHTPTSDHRGSRGHQPTGRVHEHDLLGPYRAVPREQAALQHPSLLDRGRVRQPEPRAPRVLHQFRLLEDAHLHRHAHRERRPFEGEGGRRQRRGREMAGRPEHVPAHGRGGHRDHGQRPDIRERHHEHGPLAGLRPHRPHDNLPVRQVLRHHGHPSIDSGRSPAVDIVHLQHTAHHHHGDAGFHSGGCWRGLLDPHDRTSA